MLEQLPPLALCVGLGANLNGFVGVRLAKTPEKRILALRQALMVLGIALAGFAMALFVQQPEAHLPLLTSHSDPSAIVAHVEALRAVDRQMRGWLGALALVLATAMPMVCIVLRELGSFVLVHRTDLLGRDQAAAYAEK